MVSILALWLPIVLAAVAVFAVSSVVHMVLTYHRSDYRGLPQEAETVAGLREAGLAPGIYCFPYAASPKEMGTPEMIAKYEKGPVGILTLLPNAPPPMGKLLAQWFVYCLLVAVFVAYIAGRTLSPGAEFLAVFRIAGATAFMAFGVSQLVDSIWKGQPWGASFKNVFDGLLYSLAAAAVFGWLWPQ